MKNFFNWKKQTKTEESWADKLEKINAPDYVELTTKKIEEVEKNREKVKNMAKEADKKRENNFDYFVDYIEKNSEVQNITEKLSTIIKIIQNHEFAKKIKKSTMEKLGLDKDNLIDILYVIFGKINLVNDEKVLPKGEIKIIVENSENKRILFSKILKLENATRDEIEKKLNQLSMISEDFYELMTSKENIMNNAYESMKNNFVIKKEDEIKDGEPKILFDVKTIERMKKEIEEELNKRVAKKETPIDDDKLLKDFIIKS